MPDMLAMPRHPRLPWSIHTIIQSSFIVLTDHHISKSQSCYPFVRAALLLLRSVPTQSFGKLPFGLVLPARRNVDTVIGNGRDLVLPTRARATPVSLPKLETPTPQTHLVHTPRISVEQNLHASVQNSLGFFTGQQFPLLCARSTFFLSLFIGFTEQRLSEMRGEPGGQGRGLVGRSLEVNVSEEATTHAMFTSASQFSTSMREPRPPSVHAHLLPSLTPPNTIAFQRGFNLLLLAYMILLKYS